MVMKLDEEEPGLLKKRSSAMICLLAEQKLSPIVENPLDIKLLEDMRCLVHKNGDKTISYVFNAMPGGVMEEGASDPDKTAESWDFYKCWGLCLQTLTKLGEAGLLDHPESQAHPEFHRQYGLIQTQDGLLRIEVYKNGMIIVSSRYEEGLFGCLRRTPTDIYRNFRAVFRFSRTFRRLVSPSEG
jgi:hypothetical protein